MMRRILAIGLATLAITGVASAQVTITPQPYIGGTGVSRGTVCIEATDLCFSRAATGVLGLNQDSTHGVQVDVTTDARFTVLSRSGGAGAVRASALESTSSISLVNAWEAFGPATGVMRLSNWAGTTGVRLNFAIDTNTLQVLASGGGDTAIVRASAFTVGSTAGATAACNAATAITLNFTNGIFTGCS